MKGIIQMKQSDVRHIYQYILCTMLIGVIACRSDNSSQHTKFNEYDMVLIAAGEFTMGADNPNTNPDQRPEHAVYLDRYYIGRHEVTNAEYEPFLLDRGYQKQELWSDEGWNYIQENKLMSPVLWKLDGFSDPEQPVTGISYYEAEAYAHWAGMRLPTEAEWEKAARGTEKIIYPWGNTLSPSMPYHALSRPFSIGKYPGLASPYGIQEMAGNVWEWVHDWYNSAYYDRSPSRNPKGPKTGSERILRGGSWASNLQQMKCSYRYTNPPRWRGLDVGFRLAADITD